MGGREVVEENLERGQRQMARAGLAKRLEAIAAQGFDDLQPGPDSTNDDDRYDKDGLPR